jgi:hypothetical protein
MTDATTGCDPVIESLISIFGAASVFVLLCFALVPILDWFEARSQRALQSRLKSFEAAEQSADSQVARWLDRAALDGIAQLLHHREWTVDDLGIIADVVRGTGREIGDVND